jgi:hypothetical protein
MPSGVYPRKPEHGAKIAAALRGKPLTKIRRRNISRGVRRAADEKRRALHNEP